MSGVQSRPALSRRMRGTIAPTLGTTETEVRRLPVRSTSNVVGYIRMGNTPDMRLFSHLHPSPREVKRQPSKLGAQMKDRAVSALVR